MNNNTLWLIHFRYINLMKLKSSYQMGSPSPLARGKLLIAFADLANSPLGTYNYSIKVAKSPNVGYAKNKFFRLTANYVQTIFDNIYFAKSKKKQISALPKAGGDGEEKITISNKISLNKIRKIISTKHLNQIQNKVQINFTRNTTTQKAKSDFGSATVKNFSYSQKNIVGQKAKAKTLLPVSQSSFSTNHQVSFKAYKESSPFSFGNINTKGGKATIENIDQNQSQAPFKAQTGSIKVIDKVKFKNVGSNNIKTTFFLNKIYKNKLFLKSKNLFFSQFFNNIKKTNTNKAKLISKLGSSYSKMTEINLITISLASANRIRQWAEKTLPNGKVVGEVINPETVHYKTLKPIKGGLFCERIFGPLKDHECACGKKFNIKNYFSLNNDINKKFLLQKRYFCRVCDVEYTYSIIRRTQLGYIQLASPTTHVWFVKGIPSYISILLDMKKKHLQNITYNTETLTLEHSCKTSRQNLSNSPTSIFESWQKIMKMQYPDKYGGDTNQQNIVPIKTTINQNFNLYKQYKKQFFVQNKTIDNSLKNNINDRNTFGLQNKKIEKNNFSVKKGWFKLLKKNIKKKLDFYKYDLYREYSTLEHKLSYQATPRLNSFLNEVSRKAKERYFLKSLMFKKSIFSVAFRPNAFLTNYYIKGKKEKSLNVLLNILKIKTKKFKMPIYFLYLSKDHITLNLLRIKFVSETYKKFINYFLQHQNLVSLLLKYSFVSVTSSSLALPTVLQINNSRLNNGQLKLKNQPPSLFNFFPLTILAGQKQDLANYPLQAYKYPWLRQDLNLSTFVSLITNYIQVFSKSFIKLNKLLYAKRFVISRFSNLANPTLPVTKGGFKALALNKYKASRLWLTIPFEHTNIVHQFLMKLKNFTVLQNLGQIKRAIKKDRSFQFNLCQFQWQSYPIKLALMLLINLKKNVKKELFLTFNIFKIYKEEQKKKCVKKLFYRDLYKTFRIKNNIENFKNLLILSKM